MALSQRRARIVGRLRRRRTREREGLVLVEGVRGATEALDAGAEVRFVLASPRLEESEEGRSLLARLGGSGADVDRVDDETLASLSDTETPQGVLLACVEPRASLSDTVRPGGRYLILDAVQDPGNVGTLIRAATAFALDGVLALDGTVDPWNPKTVRASAGMAFRIPVLVVGCADALEAMASADVPLLVAAADGGLPERGRSPGGWGLAVGNEGSGPRAEVLEAARAVVGIPMPGPAESLNAGMAGSILLYALTQESRGVLPTG